MGLNGFLYERVYTGGNPFGDTPIGLFTGVCTVTSLDQFLCKYEIYLYTDGNYGLGGMIVNGPVEGLESEQLVTGIEYDLEDYDGGIMTSVQDPELPILYAILSLQ